MPAMKVVRPIVRSFHAPRFLREAAAHVRAGGHAIVWDERGRARLVVPCPKEGDESDLGYWSILDLGQSRWDVETRGHLKGLAILKVPRDCEEIVRHRVERDSIHAGPTRTMRLDCLECGACCRDNEVILDKPDVARFLRAGRGHLAKKPYAKQKDGRLVLILRRDKGCKHLGADLKCGIYEVRPDACSTFPMGSECCLFSREDELGIVDGAS